MKTFTAGVVTGVSLNLAVLLVSGNLERTSADAGTSALQASRIELVDAAGAVAVVLSVTPEGRGLAISGKDGRDEVVVGRMDERVGVSVVDASASVAAFVGIDKSRARIVAGASDSKAGVQIGYVPERGGLVALTDSTGQPSAALGPADQGTALMFWDPEQRPRCSIGVNREGNGGMSVCNAKGRPLLELAQVGEGAKLLMNAGAGGDGLELSADVSNGSWVKFFQDAQARAFLGTTKQRDAFLMFPGREDKTVYAAFGARLDGGSSLELSNGRRSSPISSFAVNDLGQGRMRVQNSDGSTAMQVPD